MSYSHQTPLLIFAVWLTFNIYLLSVHLNSAVYGYSQRLFGIVFGTLVYKVHTWCCIFGYQITKTIRWKIGVVGSLDLSSILFVNYIIFHSFDWKQIRTKSPLCFDAWNLIRKLQILVRKCSYFFCVLLFREGRGKNYIMKKQLWSFNSTRLPE